MARETYTLSDFLVTLDQRVFVYVLREQPGLLRADVRPLALAAWGEIHAAMGAAREQIRAAEVGEDAHLAAALERAGLTGQQLQLKLQGFFGALRRDVSARRNAVVRWLKEVFGWANIILGSLTLAMPALEIVKEYKETLELSIDFSGRASRFGG